MDPSISGGAPSRASEAEKQPDACGGPPGRCRLCRTASVAVSKRAEGPPDGEETFPTRRPPEGQSGDSKGRPVDRGQKGRRLPVSPNGGHVGSPDRLGAFCGRLRNASFRPGSDLSRDRLWRAGMSLAGNDANFRGARGSPGLGAWKGSMMGQRAEVHRSFVAQALSRDAAPAVRVEPKVATAL